MPIAIRECVNMAQGSLKNQMVLFGNFFVDFCEIAGKLLKVEYESFSYLCVKSIHGHCERDTHGSVEKF